MIFVQLAGNVFLLFSDTAQKLSSCAACRFHTVGRFVWRLLFLKICSRERVNADAWVCMCLRTCLQMRRLGLRSLMQQVHVRATVFVFLSDLRVVALFTRVQGLLSFFCFSSCHTYLRPSGANKADFGGLPIALSLTCVLACSLN